jgi:hypothetical protein
MVETPQATHHFQWTAWIGLRHIKISEIAFFFVYFLPIGFLISSGHKLFADMNIMISDPCKHQEEFSDSGCLIASQITTCPAFVLFNCPFRHWNLIFCWVYMIGCWISTYTVFFLWEKITAWILLIKGCVSYKIIL